MSKKHDQQEPDNDEFYDDICYEPKSRVISTQIIRRQGPQVFPETAGLVR